jgi:mannan endo-1,6-alpha-mannosidase
MSEVTCESSTCNVDQRSFKAYLSRWMAGTAALAPFTADFIMPKLRASAQAAALQCNGPNNACGLRWIDGAKYDGSTGVGEQMSAMEIFQANLLTVGRGPFTNSSGGTSVGGNGDYNAVDEDILGPKMPVTNADRAGAGIVTVAVIAAILGSVWWIVT